MPLPLVEHSEKEIAQMIRKRVEAIKDLKGYHQLSVLMTGKRSYMDMYGLLGNNLRFEDAHKIASKLAAVSILYNETHEDC